MIFNKSGKKGIDLSFYYAVLGLTLFGLVMIYSASSVYALNNSLSSFHYFIRQVINLVLGFITLYVCMIIDLELLKKMANVFLIICLVLLVIVIIPGVGIKVGGAVRWLRIGFFTLQPSELAKLALLIFLAKKLAGLSETQSIKSFFRGFFPLLLVTSLFVVFLTRQPDLGMSVIFMSLLFILLFVAGTNIQYIMGTVLIIIPFAVLYIYSNPYQVKRILGFLFPELFKSNVAYQLYQSLIAIGSGGLWGQGLGDSKQKLFFLPEAHTDFILAIIAEELGFIGLVVLFLLFLFLIYRGFIISLSARDKFRFFLGVGIVSCLSLQIIINIGVVMGMLPTKGLTLPYISYGGSSLLITMAMSGIMLNISEDLFLKLPITPDDTRVVRNRRKMADCKW